MADPTLPGRRPFTNLWDFVVRAYRPIGNWVCIAILVMHGLVLPVAALLGRAVTVQLSGADLLAIIALMGLGWHQRTKEKREGLTS